MQLNGYTANLGTSLAAVYDDQGYLGISYEKLIKYARKQVEELFSQIGKPKKFTFYIAFDEAQAFAEGQTHFVISPNGTPRKGALLSALYWVTDYLFSGALCTPIIITAGTGFSTNHIELCQSATGKDVNTDTVRAIGADLIRSAQDAIKFLELHIALPDSCREWMLSKEFSSTYLPLRIRLLSRVLLQMIVKSEKVEGNDVERFKNAFSEAVSETIALIIKLRGEVIKRMLTNTDRNNLLKLIWRHYTGEQQLLPSESFVQLLFPSVV